MKLNDTAIYHSDGLSGIEVSKTGPSEWRIAYRGRQARIEAVRYVNQKPDEFIIHRSGKPVSVARNFHTAITIAASL
ncbi:hypothetical protein ABWL39_19570 [Chitinivorax sp. PXF-14]|uniref:hypothetical protein n=1 Tax=Chitinivorax sp. PXF-14 TaxID=3230488 RepID=UPI003466301D